MVLHQKLYKIAFSNSRWATGISSFIKETLIEQIDSGYVDECSNQEGLQVPNNREDYINYDIVKCINFQYVNQHYKLENVNLLQIDTEGFDYEIIKMVNFDVMKPDIISFEISHTDEDSKLSIYDLLKNYYGYSIYERGRDACALKNDIIEEINELKDFSWI